MVVWYETANCNFLLQMAETLILLSILISPTYQVPFWSVYIFNQGITAPLIMVQTYPTPTWYSRITDAGHAAGVHTRVQCCNDYFSNNISTVNITKISCLRKFPINHFLCPHQTMFYFQQCLGFIRIPFPAFSSMQIKMKWGGLTSGKRKRKCVTLKDTAVTTQLSY